MASGAAGPALAHRSVASIRGGTPSQGPSGPSTPHTPNRTSIGPSSFGSPSTVRADDDVVVIELGSRHLRAGFAGDSYPKATVLCGPETQRRVGDFRTWQGSNEYAGLDWAPEHEFWRYDLRDMDLGLFQDKLERAVRDAFTRCLLIDSRPRRLGLVLDPAVPVPLLTATLDTLFNRFQAPTISLMSTPVMSAVSAGIRSALVIDMGWTETVVTSVYEYREVKSTRTIRGGKLLLDALYKGVHALIRGNQDINENEPKAVTFEQCDDILRRLMWCRPSASASQRQSAQLETVEEQDETEDESSHAGSQTGVASVPITSTNPPSTLEIPFEKLAEICDGTFFDPSAAQSTFDDHELPVHLLIYQHLLRLPMDVRAICMSRIIFTGGCSNILGIKQRIIDDVTAMVEKRGWAPVVGKGVDQLRNNPKLQRRSSSSGSSDDSASTDGGEEQRPQLSKAADAKPEHDPIEAKVARQKDTTPQMHGQFRVLNSLGAWTGGSLLCQLKVPAMAIIDRELWMQQGASGASRPNEVDVKTQQRHSMTAGRGGGGGHHGTWTLGTWGYL